MRSQLTYCFSKIFFFSIILAVATNAFAFGDNDLERVKQALSIKIPPQQSTSQTKRMTGAAAIATQTLAGELLDSQATDHSKEEIVNALDDAYLQTLGKCEGRFDLLANLNNQQIKRSEWIAIIGGTFGVIGTIATCPHCAAAMSGLAGIANPLQATFAQNNDTPQTTQARLSGLAKKINDEFDKYKQLDAPNPSDAYGKFYSAYRAKKEQLLSIASSCLTYSNIYAPTSVGQ